MLLLPQKIATSFLALLRLVSVAYILKNLPAFRNKSNLQYSTIILYLIKSLAARHVAWIRILNAKVWERMQFEDSFIPSIDALTLHWLRSQWCSCAGNRQIVAAFNCHQLKTMGKEWRVNPTENNRCTVQDCGDCFYVDVPAILGSVVANMLKRNVDQAADALLVTIDYQKLKVSFLKVQ